MTLLEPHPVLTYLFGFPLTAHGVFFALAAVVAAVYFARRVSRSGLDFVSGVEKALLIVIAGIFGARFGYLLSYRERFVEVSQLFSIWEGGLVSFWGILVGFAMALWLARRLSGEYRREWWNALVLAGLLGWAIGRVGNYYVADSYGVLSNTWAAFYGRVPIQLFETALCLVLFVALRKHAKAAWFGVLGYLAGRMVIDYWREEALIGPFHISQWVCLLGLLILIPIYVRRRAR